MRSHTRSLIRLSTIAASFAETAPSNYRDWLQSDYSIYDALAPHLHELGILCEPDSREPWFISAAHDDICLNETLEKFEIALDLGLKELGRG